jgi:hypothetical protein
MNALWREVPLEPSIEEWDALDEKLDLTEYLENQLQQLPQHVYQY